MGAGSSRTHARKAQRASTVECGAFERGVVIPCDRLIVEKESSRAEYCRADQSRAEQSRAGQGRSEQSRAEQSRAGQSRAEQSTAEQSRAEQTRAEQTQTRADQSRPEQSRPEQSRPEEKPAHSATATASALEPTLSTAACASFTPAALLFLARGAHPTHTESAPPIPRARSRARCRQRRPRGGAARQSG